MPQVDEKFIIKRKGINICQLYTTLLDIRDSITDDEKYQELYQKILRNLSKTKKLRTYMLNDYNLKFSIGVMQNLATFVQLCYEYSCTLKKKKFEYCLLPPSESDYISWQRCILSLQQSRKSKRGLVNTTGYIFKNTLQCEVPEFEKRDDNKIKFTSSERVENLPSLPAIAANKRNAPVSLGNSSRKSKRTLADPINSYGNDAPLLRVPLPSLR